MVFNDDEMTPRWGPRSGGLRPRGGRRGRNVRDRGSARRGGEPRRRGCRRGEAQPAGAAVRIAPRESSWHRHFRPSVDGDTFEPGSGGGLLERALQSVPRRSDRSRRSRNRRWGAREPDRAGGGRDAGAMGAGNEGVPVGERPWRSGRGKGTGLFGLGQPGLVPGYAHPATGYGRRPRMPVDSRRVLMRRVDEEPPQPVGVRGRPAGPLRHGSRRRRPAGCPTPLRRRHGVGGAATGSRCACGRRCDPGPRRRKPAGQGLRRERSCASRRRRRRAHPDLSAPGRGSGRCGRRRTPRLGGTHAVEIRCRRRFRGSGPFGFFRSPGSPIPVFRWRPAAGSDPPTAVAPVDGDRPQGQMPVGDRAESGSTESARERAGIRKAQDGVLQVVVGPPRPRRRDGRDRGTREPEPGPVPKPYHAGSPAARTQE